jgi:mono/diheme cytochrome c family protein
MADTASPMPPVPNPAVAATDQAGFAGWVDAGMPSGGCSTVVDAGTVVVDPVFADAPTCTSGKYWTGGDGTSMRPGEACIACHTMNEGPRFTVAGTVFPTGHEYDDCDSPSASGAVVTVTDSAGKAASFTANSVGNFSGNGTLTFPITAIVSLGGKTRAMTTAVPSGDCNSCHTETGTNGAPGRVALPE